MLNFLKYSLFHFYENEYIRSNMNRIEPLTGCSCSSSHSKVAHKNCV